MSALRVWSCGIWPAWSYKQAYTARDYVTSVPERRRYQQMGLRLAVTT